MVTKQLNFDSNFVMEIERICAKLDISFDEALEYLSWQAIHKLSL